MFHFFIKKRFLVDYLKNFVDMHNHILPGIDDGAKTVEESVEIINGFYQFGVKDFIATPHIMHNYYPNNRETIKNSLLLLKNELLEKHMKDISIRAAAEHMIDDNFESILERAEIMPLEDNFLLVEMSYLQPSINFNDAIQIIGKNRFFPILAHPERYIYLYSKFYQYQKYKQQGILFQLNLLSLSNYYGTNVQKTALKLLDENLIDFIASDVHNVQQLKAIKEIRISNKLVKHIIPVIEKTVDNFY